MIENKGIMYPPWLFSTMSNTAIEREKHAPDSHWRKLLPWFRRLRQQPWTIQLTAEVRVEWQLERQCSNTRSVGWLRWRNRISYDNSMLEYKVIKFPSWMFPLMSNTAIGRKPQEPEIHRWKLLPWFYLLRWWPRKFKRQQEWKWSDSRWSKLFPWFWLFRRQLWTIQATAGATVE